MNQDVVLVIRFGDSGVPDTIGEHQKILDKAGETWAGWWDRWDEVLPDRMGDFLAILQSEELTIFLLHDKKSIIYPVKIKGADGLRFSRNNQKISSPDENLTPEYYRSFHLPLWFKISSIGEPLTDLSNFSYCNYVDYRTSNSHQYDYNVYNCKRVSSIQELSTQPRSIFFLRSSNEEDTDFIVNIQMMVSPRENFAETYSQVGGNSILLLSDLHFNEDVNATNYTFEEFRPSTQNKRVTDKNLVHTIKDMFSEGEIASVIIAGDLTWRGSENEFQNAELFTQSLRNTFKIDRKLFTIVPGNHDIMFDTNNYTDPMNIAIDYADATSKQGYIEFYKKIYDVEPNDYLAIGKRIILKNRFPIDIVGLNSSCLQQNGENFRGMGFIGEKQLDEVVRGMRWDEESYAYKILVLHHHIQPVEYWEEPTPGYTYSMCLDSGLLYSFIVKNKIDLVIHGHKHLSSFFQMGKMIAEDKAFYYNILGVGSASVALCKYADQKVSYFQELAFIIPLKGLHQIFVIIVYKIPYFLL